jgi:hypothetical protein
MLEARMHNNDLQIKPPSTRIDHTLMQNSTVPRKDGQIVSAWLKDSPALLAVIQGRSQLFALQQVLDQLAVTLKLPLPLTASRLDGEHLHLAVPSAAYAAKLKQLVPTIIASLDRASSTAALKISRISLRPQPELFPRTPVARQIKPVPATSLSALEALRDQTKHEGMKYALTILIKRQRKR